MAAAQKIGGKIKQVISKITLFRQRKVAPFKAVKMGSKIMRMENIVKRFPGVLANDHINFQISKGEVHALLGENGAGKTTLMNILSGLYKPDSGNIYVRGQKVALTSPRDALNLGIGMVHQHFMLISALTVTENIILGLKDATESPFPVHVLDVNRAEKKIEELSKKYGLEVNPRVKVHQLSVGEKQRVEIIKALYRGVDILILDEPTSVLTPGEVSEMFKVLRSMAKQGLTIVFITHKLTEVVSLSDRVTVLNNGRVLSTLKTHQTNEIELARLMCGRDVVFQLSKPPVKRGNPILEVMNLRAQNDRGLCALEDVSFSVFGGEILGIAGVAGNGQSELAEVVTGLRKSTGGRVSINGRDVTNHSPKEIIEQKVAHIPEDRLGTGIFMDLTVAENMILETHAKVPFAKGWFLNDEEIDVYAKRLISDFDIKTPNKNVRAGLLSGGNLQKLILARELSREPQLIIAVQPTGGLDCGAAEFIRLSLIKQRGKGKAVLLISEDLEEIFSLSDRIAVMYEGAIAGVVPAEKADVEKIGLMMGGALKS